MDGAMVKLALIFDGGSRGNPGLGYGSFRLSINGVHLPVEELDFGDNVTNNQAEYGTLIAGLERALNYVRENGQSPENVSISVLTDSKLVVEQVNGRWKVKNAGLKPLQERARALIRQFGTPRLEWHPRAESVRVLGH
jgi:ribonuclease HI